ncbi:MAG: hypothetical protein ACTSVI_09650 [Promethearchaeota archaeon]
MPLSDEEKFIINILKDAGELGYKEINEKFSEHFDGCRLVLKKLKEKGIVSFDGALPGFSSMIKYISPDEREAVVQEARYQKLEKNKHLEPLSEEQFYIIKVLEENGGKMKYNDLNDIFSEKYEGLRLLLKKLKELGRVDFNGSIPGFSDTIILVSM